VDAVLTVGQSAPLPRTDLTPAKQGNLSFLISRQTPSRRSISLSQYFAWGSAFRLPTPALFTLIKESSAILTHSYAFSSPLDALSIGGKRI